MGNYKDEYEINGVSHYMAFNIDELLELLKLKSKDLQEVTEAINKKIEAEQRGEIL